MKSALLRIRDALVRLNQWLEDCFAEPLELRLRKLDRVPALRFRRYEQGDLNRCMELYRLNATGRFPSGVDELYKKTLSDSPAGYMVAELDGEIVATCGVSHWGSPTCGVLSYGLVDPKHHKQGIGTAMLALRLVLLGRLSPKLGVWVFLCAVDDSAPFYKRFGFVIAQSVHRHAEPGEHTMRLGLTPSAAALCEAALTLWGIEVPEIEIPYVREQKLEAVALPDDLEMVNDEPDDRPPV